MNSIAKNLPWLLGGSADLETSNKTKIDGETSFESGNYWRRILRFGVREMGMGGILNGIAASGLRAFGGTFMVFSDYMRGALRLAAIMELPVTYVFTHDSIAVGEDGPTHEPVEQIMSLRLMPHMRLDPSGGCERNRGGMEAGDREHKASDGSGVDAAGGSDL